MGPRIGNISKTTAGHFTRAGIAKLSFDTEQEAAEWGERRGQVPYRCRFCKRWHVATRKVKP